MLNQHNTFLHDEVHVGVSAVSGVSARRVVFAELLGRGVRPGVAAAGLAAAVFVAVALAALLLQRLRDDGGDLLLVDLEPIV